MTTRLRVAQRLIRLQQRIEAEQRASSWAQPVQLPPHSTERARAMLKILLASGAATARGNHSEVQVTLLRLMFGWGDAEIETYFRTLNHEENNDEGNE